MSKNVPRNFMPTTFTNLGLKRTDDLGTYLGMPLLSGRVGKRAYANIVDRIRNKLSAWKAKTLSHAARYVLIRSVLSLIPTYAMQTTRLPFRLVDEVEKLTRRFFWGDTKNTHRLHWVKWSTICRDKSSGGLGIKRLRDIIKQCWPSWGGSLSWMWICCG